MKASVKAPARILTGTILIVLATNWTRDFMANVCPMGRSTHRLANLMNENFTGKNSCETKYSH